MANEEEIGLYDFKPFRRGDTFLARDLAKCEHPVGTPKAIASARMEVRTKKGTLVHAWTTEDNSLTITGDGENIVTQNAVAKDITESWVPGLDHEYDLEVIWAADGTKRTILAGKFPIKKDITLPTS